MQFDDLTDDRDDEADTGTTPQQTLLRAEPQQSFDDMEEDPHAGSSFDDLPDESEGRRPKWSALQSAAVGAAKSAVPTTGGLAAGVAAGAAATPFVTPIGGAIVGLGVGLGGGWLLSHAQDKILKAMGLDQQVQQAEEDNPTAFALGEAAPAALTLRPNAGALDLAQRGIGAGIGAATELGMQSLGDKPYDLKRAAIAAGTGAALPRLNKFGEKAAAAGGALGGKLQSKYRGGNASPDLSAERSPAPQEEDIVVANDQPISVESVATEQQPAPEVPEVGNPGAGAGTKHLADGPERQYVKGQQDIEPSNTAASEAVVQRGDVQPDAAAALAPAKPEATPEPRGEASPDVRQAEPAAPTLKHPELPPDHPANADQPTTLEPAERVDTGIPIKPEPEAAQPEISPEPEAPVDQSPLKPTEHGALAEMRQALVERGDMDKVLAHLDTMEPRQQLQTLVKVHTALNSKSGEAVGREDVGNKTKVQQRPTAESGAMARSKGDAERKNAAIKVWKDIYNEFGPDSEKGAAIGDVLDAANKNDARDYAKQVWAEAIHRNGGKDPLNRSVSYLPTMKGHTNTAQIEWLRAVKALATKGELKRFAASHVKGASEKAGQEQSAGELAAETGRIEGDIQHRPQLPEAAEANETAVDANSISRETFEMIPDLPAGKDNSYVQAQNDARKWVNELTPAEYEKLGKEYDIRTELDEPADPAELLSAMKQTLADTGKRPGTMDLPAEDAEVSITKPVDVPQMKPSGKFEATPMEEGKVGASPVKVLDKNSDEFKKLAAQYASDVTAPVKSKAEQLAASREKENSFLGLVKDFAADEGGAALKPLMQKLAARLTPQAAAQTPAGTPAPTVSPGPQANAAHLAYADSVSHDMQGMHNYVLNVKHDIQKFLQNAGKTDLTPYEWRKMTQAAQRDDMQSRPQKERDVYTQFVRPIQNLAQQNLKDIRDLDLKYKLGIELPELDKRGIDVQYVPRNKKGSQFWDKAEDDMFDPFASRSLSGYAPNLKARDFFTLRDVGPDPTQSLLTGDRMVISVDGDAKNGFEVSVLRNGAPPLKLKGIPASFSGNLGDMIPLKVKGKASNWQVDHAATDEIEKATGGKVAYHENLMYNWAKAADDTTKALQQIKLRVKILTSPDFQALTTRDPKVAEQRGYDPKPTNMKDFEGVYMPKELKWVFDDYAKPGFGGDGFIDKIRQFNMGVSKFINVNAPLVHVLNEMDLGIVARGYRWFWPPSYMRLGRSIPTAVRSVNAQDQIQREMRDAGANPMLTASLARSMYYDFAKVAGLDMMQNASKWDVVAKAFGMTTPQMMDKIYQKSSNITWRLSDYMSTAHYLELKQEGYAPKEAAKKLNKFFSDYQVGTTVMGSRALQQMLVDPATTLFGRYKAGVFRTFYHMGHDVVTGTPAQKAEALSQLAVLGALGLWGYSAVDKGLEKLSGSEGMMLRRRGASAFPNAVSEVVTGKKSPQAALVHAWTPAPAITGAMDFYSNKDFRGKDIFPQGDWREDPGVIPEGVGRVAEHALTSFVSPYSQVSRGYTDEGIGGALKASALEQFGVSEQSDRAQRYNEQSQKFNVRNAKSRQKRPEGVIPDVVNRFTR